MHGNAAAASKRTDLSVVEHAGRDSEAGRWLGTAADEVDAVLDSVCQMLGMRTSWVSRADFDDGELTILVSRNEPGGSAVQTATVAPLSETLSSAILTAAKPEPLILEDVQGDSRYAQRIPARTHPDIGSYVGVPIVLADGTVYGTLCASDPKPKRISEQHAALLAVLARLLAAHIDRDREIAGRIRAEERYQFLAEQSTDVLSIIGADGRLSYVSPSVERVLGYKVSDYMRRFTCADLR